MSPAGFANAVYQTLRLSVGSGSHHAPVCSSWVWMCFGFKFRKVYKFGPPQISWAHCEIIFWFTGFKSYFHQSHTDAHAGQEAPLGEARQPLWAGRNMKVFVTPTSWMLEWQSFAYLPVPKPVGGLLNSLHQVFMTGTLHSKDCCLCCLSGSCAWPWATLGGFQRKLLICGQVSWRP